MYRLQVPKLHCGGCAGRVTRAIHGVDPTAPVIPDLERREIAIETSAHEPAVRAALEKAGYPAVEGKAAQTALAQ